MALPVVLQHAHQHYFFFFNDAATTHIYTLSLHDALPISSLPLASPLIKPATRGPVRPNMPASCRSSKIRRSEEHTSELQSLRHLVCRLLLEKKKIIESNVDDRVDYDSRTGKMNDIGAS